MQPTVTPITYTYKKPDDDVWVLNDRDIPVDFSLVKDRQIVHFAPLSRGGNHKHPRTEWFVGIGDLYFVWLDEAGKVHEEVMNPNEQLKLITVPPFLPHAVVNRSSDQTGILYELADAPAGETGKIEVVRS